ncbi:RsmD family RNA methyltransferase [Mucisphaera sp.]|uniref:RsmD family RNA methyltransferase n=1 Tax=Mucisphaera sp. TaxID=2913024 RepID=UPI003D0FD787
MRVIAGTHRHRRLLGPPDAETTRPITDRVKQALFSRLYSLGVLGETTEEPFGPVLDLFAGTGSIGIEALSRGASHCTFVEADRRIQAILKQNLQTLGLTDRATVIHGSALLPLWLDQLPPEPLAIAFLDPPYKMLHDPPTVDRIHQLLDHIAPKLEPGAIINLRTPSDAPTPAERPNLDGPVPHKYGGMTLNFYQAPLEEDDETGLE